MVLLLLFLKLKMLLVQDIPMATLLPILPQEPFRLHTIGAIIFPQLKMPLTCQAGCIPLQFLMQIIAPSH